MAFPYRCPRPGVRAADHGAPADAVTTHSTEIRCVQCSRAGQAHALANNASSASAVSG